MAYTPAGLPAGMRVTDFISLGVLTTTLQPDLIDRVLTATGRQSTRQRQLPARLVVYYVIALALYAQASCTEVLRCLMEGARWLRLGGHGVQVACKSAITQARERLGAEPLKQLYCALAEPMAEPGAPGAWYRGRRLVSLDGTTLDLPDTPLIEERFRRPGAAHGHSAFPQMRLLALVETGTRAMIAVAFDHCRVGEVTLARQLISHLRPGMLCLADRAFSGFPLWRQAAARGADLLWRSRCNWLLPCLQVLPDGSYLSRVYAKARNRRLDRNGITVRVIEYHLDGMSEGEPKYRLLTTLLDPDLAPAAELAALYHERWQHELVFAELKVTLPGQRLILRSRRPDLVEQELYGLLLAHLTLRHLMYQASVQAACDPDTLSFAHVVRVVRRHLPFHAAFSSRQRQRMWQLVLVEIIAVRVKHKPGRTCPREVKRKIRVFPNKPPATTRRVRSNPTLQIRLCPSTITPDPDATAHVKRARKMARERFWWEHVRAWQTSGRTRTEYCCQKNLSEPV